MVCLQRQALESDMKTTIICYMGGTCGDLITAITDPTQAVLNKNSVTLPAERSKLKKPHLFETDKDKDIYIDSIGLVYNSIPSHDLVYHVKQQHDFIGIVVNDRTVAEWAADRFKKLHRPHVWEEMQKQCGATGSQDYAQSMLDFSNLVREHTDNIVQLERILQGRAVDDIKSLGIPAPGKSFYHSWLGNQQIK